jgi:arylsulfatase
MENTYVIFMSDNGAEGASYEALPVIGAQVVEHLQKYYDNSIENIGRYNSFVWYGSRWAQAATAPSRLYKMYSTEGGIRVPFILYHSSLAEGEKVCNSFCTVMDIVPTFLDLARVKHPGTLWNGRRVEKLRGKSWKQFLSGSRTQRTPIHSNDYVTGWELAGTCAIRKGVWKICWVTKPKGPEKWELFNVEEDPGEVNDLAEEFPEKLAELLAHWEEYVEETGTVGRSCDWGTMVVPVDEFEDDQKWIRYMAKQNGKVRYLNGVKNGVVNGNGHI